MAQEKDLPPARPGLKVIPLGTLDKWKPLDNTRTLVYFIFREILDEDLLRNSLDKLIRTHLPILGARIKPTGTNGHLEYHLPEPFPDGYELFRWSSSSVSSSFDDSIPEPLLRKSTGVVSWGSRTVPELEKNWIPDDWPVERKFEKPNTPSLLVHLTKYTDATVLVTNIPHAVCDQMGNGSFMKAWLQVAKGEQPPQFLSLEPGALDGPKLPEKELRKGVGWHLTTKFERFLATLSLLPELIIRSGEERRLMYLSAPLITGMRDRYNKILEEKYGENEPKLTNGDIVSSILFKFSIMHRNTPSPTAFLDTINGRGRHAALPSNQPFLHNAIAYSTVLIPVHRNTPLIEIARQHRQSIIETAKPEAVGRSFAITKAQLHAGYKMMTLDPGISSFFVTNWSNAWRGLDFSPVVVRNKGDKTANGKEEPQSTADPLILGLAMERDIPVHRFHCPVLSKSDDGFWADFSTSKKNWSLIDDLLERDPFLETISDEKGSEVRASTAPLNVLLGFSVCIFIAFSASFIASR